MYRIKELSLHGGEVTLPLVAKLRNSNTGIRMISKARAQPVSHTVFRERSTPVWNYLREQGPGFSPKQITFFSQRNASPLYKIWIKILFSWYLRCTETERLSLKRPIAPYYPQASAVSVPHILELNSVQLLASQTAALWLNV